MSLADTTSTPVFIDWQPDWSATVSITTRWKTPIVVNREGGEQRAKIGVAPKLSMAYLIRSVRAQRFAIRRAMAMQQVGKAVVVPVWTEYGVSLSFATNSVTLNAAITSLKYKVGSWIYVTQGVNACFRKITVVATPAINLSSAGADFFPVGFTWATFTAGARVYPCILGMRNNNSYRYLLNRVDRAAEQILIEEL